MESIKKFYTESKNVLSDAKRGLLLQDYYDVNWKTTSGIIGSTILNVGRAFAATLSPVFLSYCIKRVAEEYIAVQEPAPSPLPPDSKINLFGHDLGVLSALVSVYDPSFYESLGWARNWALLDS